MEEIQDPGEKVERALEMNPRLEESLPYETQGNEYVMPLKT